MELEENKSILKGAFALTLASLLVKVIGVIYKIPLSHILGDEGMGYFNTAYTVYTFFFLLCTAGVPKAIAILITESRARRNESDEAGILKSATICFFGLGLIISVLFFVLSPQISSVIGSEKSMKSMAAIAPSIVFISLSSVYRGYLNGVMKFHAIAISQFVEAALKLVVGLLFANIAYKLGLGIESISAYAIFGITVASVITYIYLFVEIKIATRRVKTVSKISFEYIKNVSKISVPITASAGIMSLVNVIDLTLIMRRLGSIDYSVQLSGILYGNYTTLAVPMFNFALSIISSVCISALPVLTECNTNKKSGEFKFNLEKTAELCAFVAAPATLLFAFYSKESLMLLFESSSVALGAPLLSFLSLSVLLITVLTIINTSLEASGKYNAPLISMSVGCLVKLLATYAFVGSESFGILGAPIGTALSYIASVVVSLSAFRIKKEILACTLKCFVKPLINSCLCVFLIEITKKHIIALTNEFVNSLIVVIAFAVIYIVLSVITGVVSNIKRKNLSK